MQFNDVYIFEHDIDEAHSACIETPSYSIGYYIDKKRYPNTVNEDVLFALGYRNNLYFGVADGAGGHPKGREAAYEAGKLLSSSVKKIAKSEEDLTLDSIRAIEQINQNIIDLKVGARSTLALIELKDDLLRCYSVGDSEIVYWNAVGRKIYSNIPDSTAGHQIEAGTITQKDSLDELDRHIVHNLLGDSTLRIEVSSSFKLKKRQILLVGSDGLFDNLPHREISKLLYSKPFKESFPKLTELCKNRTDDNWKKDDDISFIAIQRK